MIPAGLMVVGLLLLGIGLAGVVTGLVKHRRVIRRLEEHQLLEKVAAAIARSAGHNWMASMMPDHRADFYRNARAAIDAVRGRA